jgi:hypothetical protein
MVRKIMDEKKGEFFSYKNFSKSKLGFRKWTKINVQN